MSGMKLPHYIVVALACIGATLPIVIKELPAQYSGLGLAALAIFSALKIPALGDKS